MSWRTIRERCRRGRAQPKIVVPAKAGIHFPTTSHMDQWVPAFTGTTNQISLGTAIFALIWASVPVAAAADAPPGASSCSGCHATKAAVQTPVPRLVGRPAVEIVTAMQAFRAGQRPATVMDRIAKGFSEPEIASIAAWYAAQQD
jgi:sulfide dehydrogenase cytochrome subunit